MKKNKMLSLAAAMVLTTTSVMAFEALISDGSTSGINGKIVTSIADKGTLERNYFPVASTSYDNNFTDAYDENEALNLSRTLYGDALIFPAIKTDNDGWESEVTVINTSDEDAVIAKVVVYSADNSRELVDFEIFLSKNDVFSFQVRTGADGVAGLYTSDDSVVADLSVYAPNLERDTLAQGMNSKIDHQLQFNTLNDLNLANGAYVVVYGMAQTTDEGAAHGGYHGDVSSLDHTDLFAAYRGLLDDCRSDDNSTGNGITYSWRDGWDNAPFGQAANFWNGLFLTPVKAPNVDATCDNTNQDGTIETNNVDFGSVQQVLTGTVTISNPNQGTRSITLPATALENFTADNTMMLWAEGEFAAIADRRIEVPDMNAPGVYNENDVRLDSQAFDTEQSIYYFSANPDAKLMKNNLLVTQPYKRILVQLEEPTNGAHWKGQTVSEPYGGFCEAFYVYDTEENRDAAPGQENTDLPTNITSPYSSANGDQLDGCNMVYGELAKIVDLENPDHLVLRDGSEQARSSVVHDFTEGGFVKILGTLNGIVTQQSAIEVNGVAQANWIYSPTKPVSTPLN